MPPPSEPTRNLVRGFLREDLLVKNPFMLGDKRVDLGKIQTPFLHAAAGYDHFAVTCLWSGPV